jgi:HAD superfamily hydrolase (TIGR01509 family)
MDGTLLDSEPAYAACDREFLAAYGIALSEERSAGFVGIGSAEMLRQVALSFPDSPLSALSLEERVRLKDEAFLSLAPSVVRPFPSTVELARRLAERGLPMAIASGSTPEVIRAMLEATGLSGLFSLRVSASEVPRGKPAPDVFLEAARRLGVEPGLCLVLEDSRYGVAAAKAAGMACVALPDPGSSGPGSPNRGYFRSADLIVEGGAAALDPELVLSSFDWQEQNP